VPKDYTQKYRHTMNLARRLKKKYKHITYVTFFEKASIIELNINGKIHETWIPELIHRQLSIDSDLCRKF
jgi:hypothetical protein